jgi:D-lactate dehydrogenase
MKVAVFSARNYDREFLSAANATRREIHLFEPHLNEATASLAAGFGGLRVC